MDISGEQHLDVIEKPLQRHGGRLEHNETYCGSCYGAEASDDDCCNNCEEVREAYQKKGWAISNPDLIDQELLTRHKSTVAGFLSRNFDWLLGDILLDQSNSVMMVRYVSSKDNLRILMNLLRREDLFPSRLLACMMVHSAGSNWSMKNI